MPATNTGITVDEGATETIDVTQLRVAHVGVPASELEFTIQTDVAHGTLRLAGIELGASQTFTQADINAGLLSYAHDASEVIADSFVFSVSDGDSTTENVAFAITINPVNDPPAMDVIGEKTVAELAMLTFTVTATDADMPANTLTYSATGLPEGAGFDPATRRFSWMPSERQGPGGCDVTFTVSDGTANDWEVVTITVNEVNAPPVLSGVPASASISPLVTYTFTATASDPDLPAQTLTFSLDAASVAAAMTIDGSTGTFRWTASAAQSGGDFDVTVTVTDTGSPPASDSVTFTVAVVGSTWHNMVDPEDVSNDSFISPLDALLVINRLNREGTGPVPEPPATGPPFYDVNGDDFISPIDALLVINFLNSRESGEGEAEAVPDAALSDVLGALSLVAMCPTVDFPVAPRRTPRRHTDFEAASREDMLLTGTDLDLEPAWEFLDNADWLLSQPPDELLDATDLGLGSDSETLLELLTENLLQAGAQQNRAGAGDRHR